MPPKPKGAPKAALSAIKSMQAARQAAEAEMRRQEEEERRAREEEERRIEEARLKEEAERAARKEKERLHKEELRRQGKLLSKSEKERQLKNKLKLEQLLAATASGAGIHISAVEGQNEVASNAETKKKKPLYSKLKKKESSDPKKETVTDQQQQKAADQEEDDVVDDWEANLSDDSSEEELKQEFEILKVKDSPVKVEEIVPVQVDISYDNKSRKERPKELRSPICVILGHVDTGKTKLLDKIRQTNVQEGEAGGITQQIGATYFPLETLKEKTASVTPDDFEFKVPGLLIIDTPGHESFTNLRSRGSSLCNIAILVVDIMHGLEPQTIESIGLLRQRKTPFVVALNKIDRLYGWKPHPELTFTEAISRQNAAVQAEFEKRLGQTIVAFAEQGLNAQLFSRNEDVRKYVSLVPTSAHTADGIADLLMLIVGLTQKMMSEHLLYLSTLQCTVLEVKVVEGLGTTIDVILSNGILREGDRIAVCGLNGPIVTNIRALLTPQPLRELRVKSQYVHHRSVKAALGVKICAPDLEKAVAGSQLLVIRSGDDEEAVKEEVMQDLAAMLDSVDKTGPGVCVQASTLGSLEALLCFLKSSKIPVSGINIGPVYKRDITRASVMVETAKEYAVLLAFDVKIDKEARDLAEELDVRIFTADIIYHLFDQFTAYMTAVTEQKRRDLAPQAVFPCILRIVPGCVFNKRDPLVMGVDVVEGVLRLGTPLAVPSQGGISLGRVTSIELNHRPLTEVRRGGASVAIKIEHASYEPARQYGRHFTEADELVSKISRSSIDVLKESFRNDLCKEEWALVAKLKKVFSIA